MSTVFAEASREVLTAPPTPSREGARLFDQLMRFPPLERRDWVATLGRADRVEVLAAAEREGGTMYALWRDDPVGFVEDVLGEALWSKPREILEAIPHNTRIAVPSCFSSSKTWSTSRTALWWSCVYPPGTAQVVTLAPLWRQVVRQLWRELRIAHSRSGLPGTADMAQLKMPDEIGAGESVVAYGIAANPYSEYAVQGIHCFDDQTELLTDQGWKKFPEVSGEERVLTLNGNAAEWGPITEVWRHPFDGYLNLHDGGRVNFAVTDNHRFLVGSRKPTKRSRVTPAQSEEIKARWLAGESQVKLAADFGVSQPFVSGVVRDQVQLYHGEDEAGRSWKLVEYADLPESFIVRRTNTWGGGSNPDRFTICTPPRTPGRQVAYDFDYRDWATFLGWYVAEGSTTIDARGHYPIRISQKPGPKYDEIAALLTRMGIRFTRAPHDLIISHKGLALWLREHCGVGSHSKRVPEAIREATGEVMEAFLAAYAKGDGSPHNHPDSCRYITSSRMLADDVHEMLCKLGRGRKMRVMAEAGSESVMSTTGRAFTRRHATYLLNDPGVPVDSDVLKKNVQKYRYKGIVYCVSTPHQTIMVRRNGCPMWSGNSPALLLIVDEAGGIAHTIGRNLRALLTGDNARMVAIGNPPADDEGSWFEDLCSADGVKTIRISAYDTPNLSGERAPQCRTCPSSVPAHTLAKHLVDQDWVNDTLAEHGADAPYVTAKVHARFPKGGSGRILPASWVESACDAPDPQLSPDVVRLCDLDLETERSTHLVHRGAQVGLGVDVAADGGDEFVIARAVGDLGTIEHFSSGLANADPLDVAGKALVEIRRAQLLRAALGATAPVRVKIDVIGVGWGVYGVLKNWGTEGLHDAVIVAVDVRESTGREATNKVMKPYRKRDEMWINLRGLIQPGPLGEPGALRLRIDRRAAAQMSGPTYGTGSHGLVVIESKDSMKKRGLSSPDRAEAVLMAYYEPAAKGSSRPRLVV